MEKVGINVLMIGRSGVGKSSLLNYIFDEKLEETGSGPPCTKPGIYEHILKINNSNDLHLYDTWGLEPDKVKEWKKLIENALREHNCENIKDWFHFIIYCLNVKAARIEDFEYEMIMKLVKEGNHIIIALTQCDGGGANKNANITGISNCVCGMGVKKEDIVKVCSVEKKLIGGTMVHKFGKAALLKRIQIGFWETICDRLPVIINQYARKTVEKCTEELKNYVDNSITFWNAHSNKNYERMNHYCESQYNNCFTSINRYADTKFSEVTNYYFAVCDTLYPTNKDLSMIKKENKRILLDYKMSFDDKLTENIATMAFALIPFVGFFVPTIVKEHAQETYKNGLDQVSAKMIEECDRISKDISSYLKTVKVEY